MRTRGSWLGTLGGARLAGADPVRVTGLVEDTYICTSHLWGRSEGRPTSTGCKGTARKHGGTSRGSMERYRFLKLRSYLQMRDRHLGEKSIRRSCHKWPGRSRSQTPVSVLACRPLPERPLGSRAQGSASSERVSPLAPNKLYVPDQITPLRSTILTRRHVLHHLPRRAVRSYPDEQ
jgi:hypothetical protein